LIFDAPVYRSITAKVEGFWYMTITKSVTFVLFDFGFELLITYLAAETPEEIKTPPKRPISY